MVPLSELCGPELAASVAVFALLQRLAWIWMAPRGRSPTSSGSNTVKVLTLLVSFFLLIGVAEDVLHHGPLVHADTLIETSVLGHLPPKGVQAFTIVSWFGALPTIATLLVVIAVFLGLRRNWMAMIAWTATIIGTVAFSIALKILVPRPRPPGSLATINDSFPSGHAILAVAAYGMVCHLLHRSRSTQRSTSWITGILILLIIVIGISRVCVGDHYPTDILAGYSAGGVCLSLAIIALNITSERRSHRSLQSAVRP